MDSIIARTNEPIQDVSLSLIQQIQQASINLRTARGGIDEDSRKMTLSLAKELVLQLEKPEDVVMRYVFEVRPQILKSLIVELIFVMALARGALHNSSPKY